MITREVGSLLRKASFALSNTKSRESAGNFGVPWSGQAVHYIYFLDLRKLLLPGIESLPSVFRFPFH